MGVYTETVQLLLKEAANYFFLLLISVLAIRLWRRTARLSAGHKGKNLLLACLASMVAGGVGYLSLCHSLSLLYSHYGMAAFKAGNTTSALSLFQTSSGYWKTADAQGEQGICLLFLGYPDQADRLLDEAKSLRHGGSSSFEQYYEGLYYYYQGQLDRAVPLFKAASHDGDYYWSITKLSAVIQLDENQPEQAELLMKPFAGLDVTEFDQAYVMASLDLFAGKKDAAKILVDQFGSPDLLPFWKSRFDKLRAKIQNPTP